MHDNFRSTFSLTRSMCPSSSRTALPAARLPLPEPGNSGPEPCRPILAPSRILHHTHPFARPSLPLHLARSRLRLYPPHGENAPPARNDVAPALGTELLPPSPRSAHLVRYSLRGRPRSAYDWSSLLAPFVHQEGDSRCQIGAGHDAPIVTEP